MNETMAHGYSSESTQSELSNEYQHDRVKLVFKNTCVLVLWTKVVKTINEENGSSPSLYNGHMTGSETSYIITGHVIQCQHLIPALNVGAAQAYYTPTC